MNDGKLLNWLQLFGTFGILGGLVLVVIQIDQATELTRYQMENQWFSSYQQRNFVMMGENPTLVLAKAIDDPEDLTTEELLVLENYVGSYLIYWEQLKRLHELGFLEDERWREHFGEVTTGMNYFFGNPVSRAWAEALEERYGGWSRDQEFNHAFLGAVKRVNAGEMKAWHSLIRERIPGVLDSYKQTGKLNSGSLKECLHLAGPGTSLGCSSMSGSGKSRLVHRTTKSSPTT